MGRWFTNVCLKHRTRKLNQNSSSLPPHNSQKGKIRSLNTILGHKYKLVVHATIRSAITTRPHDTPTNKPADYKNSSWRLPFGPHGVIRFQNTGSNLYYESRRTNAPSTLRTASSTNIIVNTIFEMRIISLTSRGSPANVSDNMSMLMHMHAAIADLKRVCVTKR